MRCLPVADDCGISPGITRAILRGIDSGALRGTSILAGGANTLEAALALAARRRGMATPPEIGIHLNLLEGNASAPARDIPLLADERGIFRHSLASLWAALAFSSRRKKEALLTQVEREFSAQIECVQSLLCPNIPEEDTSAANNGIVPPGEVHAPGGSARRAPATPPLYLDGHLHVHALPALRPVLESLLQRYSVARVRVPREPRFLPPVPLALCITGTLRRELLSFWSGPLRALLRRYGVTVPDFFLGAFCSGSMTLPRLRAGLARVRALARRDDALVEIMLHPGEQAPVDTNAPGLSYAAFYRSPAREAEARMLFSAEYHHLMRLYDSCWPLPAPASPPAPTAENRI